MILAWNPRNEDAQLGGSSTPKAAGNDGQTFISLPNYTGSDIPNFNLPEEENVSNEELASNRIESSAIIFDQDDKLNASNSHKIAEKSLKASPIATSTPVIRKEGVTPLEKNVQEIDKESSVKNMSVSNSFETLSTAPIRKKNKPSDVDSQNSKRSKKSSQSFDSQSTQFRDFP